MFNTTLFGKVLRFQRIRNRHNLQDVSDLLGISVLTHRYEHDTHNPTAEKAILIAHQYLKLPLDIFTVENQANPAEIIANKPLHGFDALLHLFSFKEFLYFAKLLKRLSVTEMFENIKTQRYSTIESDSPTLLNPPNMRIYQWVKTYSNTARRWFCAQRWGTINYNFRNRENFNH